MYSVYANGKEAEKINEFVKQKTGFDVSPSSICNKIKITVVFNLLFHII
jgi:hypothetical protein